MRLFGYEFKRQVPDDIAPSFAPKENDDGALIVAAGGSYGTYVDLDGTVRSEAELVTKYRDMSLHPEIDSAVDEIINEVVDIGEKEMVSIFLDNLEVSDKIKAAIREEFDNVLNIIEFEKKAYEIIRRWYIDGRLYYHVIIDEKDVKGGIKEIRYIDPRKIRKVREVIKKKVPGGDGGEAIVPKIQNEYYIYNDIGFNYGNKVVGSSSAGIKIARDSIVHITSGLTDTNGTMVLSYVHKAIKSLNQLRTLEDALVIYRLARAPERRIWYIDVGNLPKMKAEQYVRDIMVKHKNRLIYDASTGEVRDDRKFMCYALDTKIPLLDGRTLTIQDIIAEYQTGKTNWVYSCDPKTGEFMPGPISWAGITKHNSDVVRVTFDNGKSVICTPDHKFPVWNKGFVEAQHLSVGESLIPGYRRHKAIMPNGRKYEQIYKNDTKDWEFTHRIIAKWKDNRDLRDNIISSMDYIDEPKNTIQMNLNRSNIKSEHGSHEHHAEQLHNHKVVSVERLDEKMTVAALTIDQEETYHSHHTYLLDAGVYTKNTMLEDYWLPRREGGRGTEVTTLPGGQTLGEMDDVLYFQKKLYQTLNIPINRLNSDALFSLGRATEVTRDELKFAKFVTRIRARFAVLFTDILEKQVVLKGIMSIEDWNNISPDIKYTFAKDNYFTELKDSEILQNRVNLMQQFVQGGMVGQYYSHEWVRKNILQQSDDAIEDMDKQIVEEQADPRWNPPQMDDGSGQMNPDQGQGQGQDDEAAANGPDEDYNKKMQEAQAVHDLLKQKKNKSIQDEAKYRSVAQILARNK